MSASGTYLRNYAHNFQQKTGGPFLLFSLFPQSLPAADTLSQTSRQEQNISFSTTLKWQYVS